MNKCEISIVAPVYQEEEIIGEFHEKLTEVMRGVGLTYEVIYVDDGSGIATFNALKKIADSDQHVKILRLSRNFGHQAALTAGIDNASGDAVIMLDSDLQQPPALIPTLIKHWKDGYDIVYTVRDDVKGASFFKKLTASIFYRLMARITDVDMDMNCADFRLMSRKAVEGFKKIRENARFIRGLVGWMGYRKIAVPYIGLERKKGRSKYTLGKMFKFAMNGILSFSVAPIRLISLAGLFVSISSFLYLLRVAYFVLFEKQVIPDLLPITSLILFLVGVQMLMIGVLGEYLAEVFTQVKNRPLYLVDEIYQKM